MDKITLGILAHVDAGKTTLAEAMLYKSGVMRTFGRVDDGNTMLDTHSIERERGITVFASGARLCTKNFEMTLLDTPGHVDFSSETERVLQVLDYAVLVISSLDGVQSHTRTLWRLLALYGVPTFIFVTKMDFKRHEKEEIMSELCRELDSGCVDFSPDNSSLFEDLATCSEGLLEKYLETGTVEDPDIKNLILSRRVFPCCFGSGLEQEGVEEFISLIDRLSKAPEYPDVFGAKVFKISRDKQGERLTHMKITGGELHVRDSITLGEKTEKINRIRIYTGEKFVSCDTVGAGDICAVTGLSSSFAGQGLGYEEQAEKPVLEPVMSYRVVLPPECDVQVMLRKLKELEEEEPQLHIEWNSFLQEIHVSLMGEVQTEILKSLVLEKFGVNIEIDKGNVLYKETIEDTVEGVGHYEPLKHYAETHLLLEPLPRGKGIIIDTRCSEDQLDRNWQRLIMFHLTEKPHLGVLTGSPITDMKITLMSGKAHLKHTEGGDFRQATYRAVRQGLMQAKSKLLEPYYSFRLEVPYEYIGRAITDIRLKHGIFSEPEVVGEMSVIKGRAPVVCLNGYALEVSAYTGGRGRLMCEPAGYDECHNTEEVIREMCYQPEADMENSPDSVFCAHGSGFVVKWDKVPEYMHLESCMKKSSGAVRRERAEISIDEKELEELMLREFGPIRRKSYSAPRTVKAEEKTVELEIKKQYVIVDGYNVIFAWDELKKLAEQSLEDARDRLMHILCNYSAFTGINVVLVFDAYMVEDGKENRFDHNNIHVVYTKERELGDNYIEKLASEIGKNEHVRVVTSDRMIQLSALRFGLLRTSAAEFEREVDRARSDIEQMVEELKESAPKTSIGDAAKKS